MYSKFAAREGHKCIYSLYRIHAFLRGFEPKAEVHVVGGLQDAQAGARLVQRWHPGLRVQELHLEVRQDQQQELLDLVDGEEPPGTFGHT